MRNPNETLPQNFQQMVQQLAVNKAMPIGTLSDIPFVGVKMAEDAATLFDESIVCEMKPTVVNVDYDKDTIALCFVQFRLNDRDDHTYTAIYDLKNEKHYEDCYALLNMQKYGLFLATQTLHDFLVFDTNFEAFFDPRDVIKEAKEKATEYEPDMFTKIAYAVYTQLDSDAKLWKSFKEAAPLEKQWYVRMKLDLIPATEQ